MIHIILHAFSTLQIALEAIERSDLGTVLLSTSYFLNQQSLCPQKRIRLLMALWQKCSHCQWKERNSFSFQENSFFYVETKAMLNYFHTLQKILFGFEVQKLVWETIWKIICDSLVKKVVFEIPLGWGNISKNVIKISQHCQS